MSGSYPQIQVPDFGATLFRAQAARLAQAEADRRQQEFEQQNALTEAFRRYAPGLAATDAGKRMNVLTALLGEAPQAAQSLIPLVQQERQGQELAAALGGARPPGPQAMATPSGGGWLDTLAADESGGNPTARNPRSTATGTYQFIDGTWRQFAQANPDLFRGMSDQQIMAARNDPQISRQAAEWYARENGRQLSSRGLPVNDGTLALSHRFGPEGATALLQAPAATPIAQVVGQQVMAANPDLAGRTVGDVVGRYQQRFGGDAMPASAGADNPRLAQIDAQIERLTPLAASNPRAAAILQQLMAQRQLYMRAEGTPPRSPERLAQDLAVAQAGRPSVEVRTDTARGKADADSLKGMDESARNARATIAMFDRAEQAVRNTPEGAGAQLVPRLGQIARAFGLDIQGTSEAEVLQGITTSLASLQRVPGSGATTDFEMRLYMQAVPRLGNTREGNLKLIEMGRKLARRRIEEANVWRRHLGAEDLQDRLDQLGPVFSDAERALLEQDATPAPQTTGPGGRGAASPPPPASGPGGRPPLDSFFR